MAIEKSTILKFILKGVKSVTFRRSTLRGKHQVRFNQIFVAECDTGVTFVQTKVT
jgi:hypothetical protein